MTSCCTFLCLAALFSCKQNIDQTLKHNEGNLSIASVTMSEDSSLVELLSDRNPKYTPTNYKLAQVNPEKISKPLEAKYLIHEHTDFDYIVNLESNAYQKNKDTENKLNPHQIKSNLQAVDVALNPYKKFRLVLYEAGKKDNPIYNEVLQVNQKPDISLPIGSRYDWYAFTIGDTNHVPDFDGSKQVIEKSEIGNKDFMFAKGSLLIEPGQNFLRIIFKRQTGKILVNFNTRGIFGPMHDTTKISVGELKNNQFTSIVKVGDFNIFSEKYTNISDAGPQLAKDAKVVDARWGNEEKLFSFYIIANEDLSIEANSLAVKINSLSITLDDNSTRAFTPNSLVPISNYYTLLIKKGYSYKTNVRLIESTILVNNVRWARTNYIYDSNKLFNNTFIQGQSNAYRFRPNNNYSKGLTNEYWNYATTTPTGTDYNSLDPCNRVYPEYTWSSPTNVNNTYDFNRLLAVPYSYTVTPMSDGGYRHSFEWQGEGAANPAYPDGNKLILNFLGRRVNGVVQENPRLTANAAGTFYLHAGYAQFPSNGGLIPYVLKSTKAVNGNPGSITFVAANTYDGHPIRCVR